MFSRLLSTAARSAEGLSLGRRVGSYLKWGTATALTLAGAGQLCFGKSEGQFYERKFIADLDTQDADIRCSLTEFFGGEGLMDIYCVFAFMKKMLMSTGFWDDDGAYHVSVLGQHLTASMEFEEEGADLTGDGELEATSFTKKERFHDTMFGLPLWDMVTEFGFHTLDDGRIEVFQRGASFNGFFAFRLFFQIFSYWHIWATKKHINSPAFSNPRLSDQREKQPQNIPLHILKDFLTGLTYDVREAGGEEVEELQEALEDLQERLEEQSEQIQEFKAMLKLREEKKSAASGAQTHAVLYVSDVEMQKTLRAALMHVSAAGEGEWNLRAVTPTWIDGKEVTQTSQAWKALLEHPDLDQTSASIAT